MTSKLLTTESSRISYMINVKTMSVTEQDKNLARLLSIINKLWWYRHNVHLHSLNPHENATVAFIAS